jgi:F-type H+-transporting ATPase subunit epsilon
LEIVTPDRKVFDDQVQMVIVRGAAGDLGILAGHVPLATVLKVAPARVKFADGSTKNIAISGGFIEVKPNKVIILADAAELPEEIDVNRAERARQRAEQRLAQQQDDVDQARAERALQRALGRIEAAKQSQR